MNRNWTLTLYTKQNTISKQFVINDRSESEADNEAMRYIENFRIELDWTLAKATLKETKTLSELN